MSSHQGLLWRESFVASLSSTTETRSTPPQASPSGLHLARRPGSQKAGGPAQEREARLLSSIDPSRIPRHIAIIMDGNRRWAKQRFLPYSEGHRAGAAALRRTIEACADLGVEVLTAYAFSKENWRRTRKEVEVLMYLFEYFIKKERRDLISNGIQFRIIGSVEEMPAKLLKEFRKTEELTRENARLVFNLAVNYGGRAECIEAVRTVARKVRDGILEPEEITDDVLSQHLYTTGLPDPDLLIRTSGELRVSNFLLWQIAYTELWFTSQLWPDFLRADLLEAIVDFQQRKRTFGGN